MAKIVKAAGVAVVLVGIAVSFKYILTVNPPFPPPPPDAVQSVEEGDSEDLAVRRAYFTNYTRDQVVEHYKAHFRKYPTFRLNYPPEDAQTLIRDQTRSYYLEELVHPMRESLYINGFVPQRPQDEIWYKGEHFEQKITIKYVSSKVFWRVAVIILVVGIMGVLAGEWMVEVRRGIGLLKKK